MHYYQFFLYALYVKHSKYPYPTNPKIGVAIASSLIVGMSFVFLLFCVGSLYRMESPIFYAFFGASVFALFFFCKYQYCCKTDKLNGLKEKFEKHPLNTDKNQARALVIPFAVKILMIILFVLITYGVQHGYIGALGQ